MRVKIPFLFFVQISLLTVIPISSSLGTTFVKPGDTGRIEFPIENDIASDFSSLEDVQISINAPSHFIVKGTSLLGPNSIQPAQTQTFVVDYEISSTAPEGSFDVTLNVGMTTTDVDPDPSTLASVVTFAIDTSPPEISWADGDGNVVWRFAHSTIYSSTVSVTVRGGACGPSRLEVFTGEASGPGGDNFKFLDATAASFMSSHTYTFSDLPLLGNLPIGPLFYLRAWDQCGRFTSPDKGFFVCNIPPGTKSSIVSAVPGTKGAIGISAPCGEMFWKEVILSRPEGFGDLKAKLPIKVGVVLSAAPNFSEVHFTNFIILSGSGPVTLDVGMKGFFLYVELDNSAGTVQNRVLAEGAYTVASAEIPVGSSVAVVSSVVRGVWENVTTSGKLSVKTTDIALSGFAGRLLQVGSNAYEISTTATFSGNVKLSFRYDKNQVTPEEELRLKLLKVHNDGSFEEITVSVDTATKEVTGIASSLGIFAIGVPPDSTPPTASITLSPPSPLKAGTVNVTLTASERLQSSALNFAPQSGSTVPISLVTTDSIIWTGTITISTNSGDGTATFTWTGFDLAGNAGTVITSGGSFVIDTTSPAVAITSPANNAFLKALTLISGTASDNLALSKVEVQLDSGAFNLAAGSTSWTFALNPALPDGIHTITVRAADSAGNIALSSVSVLLDNTLPTVAITFPANNSSVKGSVTISGTAADNAVLTKVELQIDGGAFNSVTGLSSWSAALNTTQLSEGAHTVTARATDSVGNTGSVTITFTLDNTAPTAAITMNPPSPVPAGAVNVMLTAPESLQSASLSYALARKSAVNVPLNGSGSSWSGSFNIAPKSSDGAATFSFSGTDLAGNIGTLITSGASFEIDSTPPIGNFRINVPVNSSGDPELLKKEQFTSSPDVTLNISAADFKLGRSVPPTKLLLSFDRGKSYTEEPFVESKQVNLLSIAGGPQLSDGGVFKQVWMKFKDAAGNESRPVSNGIVLTSPTPAKSVILLRKK